MTEPETMEFEGVEDPGGPPGPNAEPEYDDEGGFENDIDLDEDFNSRGGRGGRGAFRGRGNWNGPGPRGDNSRFRGGRGYGPGGPPNFRGGRGGPPPLFGRGGPRNGNFNGPPGFNNGNWGGPPGMGPPGQMGVPPNLMGGPGGPFGPPGLLGGPPNMGGATGGPPPLMSGQGQYGQNMAPPMDMNGEIWVETKSGEGKPYYYNARTRETTWTKPEGPNVKVILQDQVEAMAQAASAGQIAPGTTTAAQAALAQANITNKPEGDEDMEKSNGLQQQQGPPGMMQGPPPGMGRFPGGGGQFGGPPFGMPPPGFQGNWGPGGPQWGGPPGAGPPWSMPPGMMQQQQPQQPNPLAAIDEAVVMSKIDPEIIAKATDWTEHKSPDGRFYYYHAKKGESVWEKPQDMKDLETAKLAAAQGISTRPSSSIILDGMPMMDLHQQEVLPGKQEQVLNGNEQPEDPAKEEEDKRKKVEDDARRKKEDEEKAKELKAQDKSRPISSTPVPGTPWCVVWTGDGRVFFYNPSSRTSVWERPEDLISRTDVDKMVANPPDAVSKEKLDVPPTKVPTKRSGSDESDSDEEEVVPAKKSKKDEIPTNGVQPTTPIPATTGGNPKKIDIGKEAAIEAEVRAAKERAVIPLDTRIKSFKEMLAEKEVSAFSTWEKELHKIVFDHRYLLLTSKERKQVFEKYVKERAEDERREKRNKLRERKDSFRKLLSESHLHGKSSFSDFAQKVAKDERFKGVEKMRERESLFNEHLIEVRRREKEEKFQRREQVKKDFILMLREQSDVDRHARWSDVKKKFDADVRYKAVESSGQRDMWFREYCKMLKDEKKRAKEKDREHKRERGDKEKHKKKDRDRERDSSSSKHQEKERKRSESGKSEKEIKDAAVAVVGDLSVVESVGDAGEVIDVAKDEEISAVEDEGAVDGVGEDGDDSEAREEDVKALEAKEKEKKARAEVSMREREKEVQRTLATHMRDRDKEREQHKRDESIQHFNALLADLVRNAELGWREVKRILRKDHRWDLADSLPREEREKLFNEHIESLLRKKREKFRELLDETTEVDLTSSWKEIKKLIRDDPRYTKFASSERCEREYKDYLKDKLITAKGQFKELLQETKLISHKSLQTLRENQSHMAEIEEILKNDKRYLVLDFIPEERTQLVLNYLEELDRRGPPPPPTASEPTRRSLKIN